MKLYRNIIIVVVLVALLGVAMFFISQYQPETMPENLNDNTKTEDMINVYKANRTDVTKIYIKNADEEYTLEQKNGVWTLNGDTSIRIKQTAADSVAYACTSVSVKQTVSDDGADAEKYGFSNPIGIAELTFKDGTIKTISVGSLSLDKENYYVMLSGDTKIYLKNTYGTESMIPKSLSLRDMMLLEINSDDLSGLRHFYMAKQGNTAVRMEYTNIGTEQKSKMQWKMIEPVYAEMNGQVFVDKVIGDLEKFEALAVIEDHPQNLSLYGLDNPYATFSVGETEKTSSFKIGNETENYRYIMEDGYSTVYVIRKSDLAFLDVAYMDLMSNLIHVEYIDTVDVIEVISPEKVYRMEIKGDKGNEKYFIDGIEIQKEDFSKAYQAVIGISLDSLDLSEEPDINPEAQIKYQKDDGTTVVVNFLPVDERNYRVTVDRKGNSVTSKKNFTDVLKKIEETVNNAK